MTKLILGVDGGNTKTIALLAASDGTILGAGRSECSDIYGAASPQAALDEIPKAVLTALGRRPREEIVVACFSLAGADWPEDYIYLQTSLEALGFGRKVVVYNDALGALRVGSPDGTGVVIACGTGVATAARNANGDYWHTSFWQESLGGLELGKQALRAVYRSELGIDPPTTITAPVLAHFGQRTVEGVLRLLTARGTRRPTTIEMSKLAPIVLREADRGDGIARQIIEDHGVRLADYALIAVRRVGLENTRFTLVLNGGIFRHPGVALVDAITTRIQAISPGVSPIRSQNEPAVGALLLAFEAAGLAITPALIKRLSESAPPSSFYLT